MTSVPSTPDRLEPAPRGLRAALGRIPSLSAARRLPGPFWTLWGGMLINRLAGFVVPFLALYLTRERGMSPAEAGAIVSLHGLGCCVSGPAGGLLADRWGRKNTMLLGLAAGALATIGLGFARAPLLIGGLVLAVGLLGELYRPAVHAAVADLVPGADRPTAFGLIYWAVNLAFALGMVGAGWLAGRTYTVLFLVDGVTTLLFAGLIALRLPETRPARAPEEPAEEGSYGAVLADRAMRNFLLLSIPLFLVFHQFLVALPIDMAARGIAPQRYGTLIALNGVLIVLLQPFAGDLLGRFDRRRVLAISTLLVGIGFGLHGLVHAPLEYAIAITLWTLGEIGFSPASSALVADLAPTRLRGRYQGAFSFTGAVAGFAAPVVGSFVLGRYGSVVLWGGCFLALALAAAGHWAAARASSPPAVVPVEAEPAGPPA